jgi:hypothetical protein
VTSTGSDVPAGGKSVVLPAILAKMVQDGATVTVFDPKAADTAAEKANATLRSVVEAFEHDVLDQMIPQQLETARKFVAVLQQHPDHRHREEYLANIDENLVFAQLGTELTAHGGHKLCSLKENCPWCPPLAEAENDHIARRDEALRANAEQHGDDLNGQFEV